MLPGPTNVPPRVMQAMLKPIINHRGPEFHEFYPRLLEKVKYVFQTQNDVLVLTSSGTGSVDAGVSNVIKPGDKAIVPVMGTFSERVADLVKAYGGVPITLSVDYGKAPKASDVEELFEKNKDAKALIVVHNETSTGVTVRDLAKMGEIAKKYGALFLVDAISILGGDELPVDKWNIDICMGASQKCLAAPPGLALISISQDAWKVIERQNDLAPRYFNLLRYKRYLIEDRETPYTPALSLMFALDEAINMIMEEGLDRWIWRQKLTARAFYKAFEEDGLSLFAEENSRSNTVIAVKVPQGVSSKTLREIMRTKYSVVVAGGFGKLRDAIFRVGNMGIVSAREVVTTIAAVEGALKELGIQNEGRGLVAALELLKELK
ncbi:MAG: aminotransferase [Candidatus Methanomethylicota archaeon]|uniref:Aminotransferase n=1 Tax=Thermoproteota archaeon TaxID=2056631 RepID=A0A497EU42_9CREN|nr:MAG: aminotransferase [Candidatus Verstraetearchaeota archaeon]